LFAPFSLGITVQCWRPAFGDVDDRIRYIANALGMTNILWAEDTNDWDYAALGLPAVDSNYQGIVTNGNNGTWSNDGTIVLSHELDNTTMSEAEKWLPIIAGAYKHILPVGVALNMTNPYIEGTVKQPSFDQYAAGTLTLSPIATPTIASTPATLSMPLTSGAKGSITPVLVYSGTPVPASGTVALSQPSNLPATSTSSTSTSTKTGKGGSSGSSNASSNNTSSGSKGFNVLAGMVLGAIGGMILVI